MSRPTPRRPASSRGQTPRPRKIAGQSATTPTTPSTPTTPTTPAAQKVAGKTATATPSPARLSLAKEAGKPKAAATGPETSAAKDGARPGVLARPKTTRVLIIALGLLALLLAGQAVWWIRHDGGTKAVDAGSVTVPDDRPVVADQLAVQDGVESAAKAAQEIVAVDFQKYDEEVDAAAELMTSQFEAQYRKTAGDIRDDFVANKTVVQANVVAQGVVRANRTRLEALVFLNQVVTRTRDGKPETVLTPFKVLVTMVHTDNGWLVDGLDTDAPRDKSK